MSAGESPVYVKEMLGHSSIQITVDIYGKWIQTERNVGVNRLDTGNEQSNNPQPIRNLEKVRAITNCDYGPSCQLVPKARLELAQAYAH